MAEAEEVHLRITGKEAEEAKQSRGPILPNQTAMDRPVNFRRRFLVAMYSVFLLAGQSSVMLLSRLYFDKGGSSTWMATLVQPAGFIFLLPIYFISPRRTPCEDNTGAGSPSNLVIGLMYVLLGIFLAAGCMLYTVGQKYLPVSTYSLLCASQLGFNALFSFFLNSQKFTPFIVNSLLLLTISSALLAFQGDQSAENPQGKYAIGFICTVAASALYGLTLSLTQLAFNKKILKQETFKVVLGMIIYVSAVSACIITVGLFASGEWKGLSREMQEFELGKASYLMTLIWTAISFQLLNIGCTALVSQVSSLFSNVISTLGLPIVPVLAVFIFGERMDGIKAIALALAIWGSISYIYQLYLDD